MGVRRGTGLGALPSQKLWEARGFYATYIACVGAAGAFVLIPNDRELLSDRWVNRPWNNYFDWTIIIVLFALSLLLAAQVIPPNLFP